ncbi:predicted protein [Histoplasma capsulatum H143]|uniref:Uncharacterized protein n=1 Tax=Ajellomyces capsulatus (strain H143) TaxID=544712 RepID=C6HR91_AJECH|nr:predicted protein [Histoplasma capsulatum H143]
MSREGKIEWMKRDLNHVTRGTQRNGGTERIAMSINTLTICEWETDLISNIFKLSVPRASELFYEQPRECDDGRRCIKSNDPQATKEIRPSQCLTCGALAVQRESSCVIILLPEAKP